MSCRLARDAVLWAVLWAALWIMAGDDPKSFRPRALLPKTVGAFRCLAEGLLAQPPRPGAA